MADIHIHLPQGAGAQPNADAPPARSGVRRAAIQRVFSAEPSDGEKAPNLPGETPAANTVKPEPTHNTPGKKTPDKNKKPLEKTPPFAKEQLSSWSQASEKARALHRKSQG
jgi:hypothetical protein